MNTAFIDVDSQLDFLYPSGALYVPKAELTVPNIARLNRYAAEHGIPVISTTDAHAEDDIEFRQWPHHCVAGTLGQRKAESTLLAKRVVVPNHECNPTIDGAEQIVVEKQTVDVFAARNLERVIEKLNADRFVVYGVVTEICVLFAVRGLLKRGGSVTVVQDAVETLRAPDSEAAFGEMRAAGASVARTRDITGS
jgi:nicotinamidase/pyrazinamidase